MGVELVKFVERGVAADGKGGEKAPARTRDEGKAVDPLRERRKGIAYVKRS
jgi:hypothetical protein